MWQIKTLTNKKQILAFLQQDRIYAAYAIGDLEPSLFAQCQWLGAENDGDMQALALFFTGLQPPALFTMGDTDGAAAILESALQPRRAYFTCGAEHLPVVNAFYALGEIEEMFRMAIAPSGFRPVSGPATKLDLSRLDALRQLYRLGGGDAFAPYQLRDGVYYGVEADRQLISAAGTHLGLANIRCGGSGQHLHPPRPSAPRLQHSLYQPCRGRAFESRSRRRPQRESREHRGHRNLRETGLP